MTGAFPLFIHWPDYTDEQQCYIRQDVADELFAALESFVSVRDQMPQSAKLVQKALDGLTPIQVTVTKTQFLSALAALAKARGETA